MALPSIAGPATTDVKEDVPKILSGFSIDDADGGQLYLSIDVTHGKIEVDPAYSGLVTYDPGFKSLIFDYENIGDINAALSTLNYRPDPNFNGHATIGLFVQDGTHVTARNFNINVNAVNDPPVNQGPTAVDVSEDTLTALSGYSVSDADDDLLYIIVSVRHGKLGFDPAYSSIVQIQAASNGLYSLRVSTRTSSEINPFLASLTYEPNADYYGPDLLSLFTRDTIPPAPAGDGHTTLRTLIDVTPVNDPPEIVSNGGGASDAMVLEEGQTLVTRVVAIDIDSAAIRYKISGGADANRFDIDAKSGKLSFKAAPDFGNPADSDGDNVYRVLVKASDGQDNDEQELLVTVTKSTQPKPPEIVSNGGGDAAAVSVAENTDRVAQVLAQDDDGGKLRFSIAGGADAGKFEIDPLTGTLTFKAPPDFEAPTDTGGNNVYEVIVKVNDGKLTDTQALAVTVTDAEEAPVITSDGGGSTALLFHPDTVFDVTTVVATDSDAGDTIAYSILGGPDASLFTIDQNTGALNFIVAPSHGAPTDADGDNAYHVVVGASDGFSLDDQSLTIVVDDTPGSLIIGTTKADTVDAGNTVGGQPGPTEHGDFIVGRHGPDTLSGLAGDDLMFGGVGPDKLKGGRGDDVISGGWGFDVLKGGAGADMFLFDYPPQRDRFTKIKDFTPDEDVLAFDHDHHQYLPPGDLADEMLRIGRKARDDDDRIIYDRKSGKVKLDGDGVGGKKAIHVATLDKKLDLDADDILIL